MPPGPGLPVPAPTVPRPPPPRPSSAAHQLGRSGGRRGRARGGPFAPHGLVTITGSGGCGKTRLALQVAAEALGERADEAWFVDLSGLSDPGLVPSVVMTAMGVQEVAHQSQTETLTAELAEQGALIVLDNCEHVLAGTASLAETLVRRCGRLVLLATSRQPLGVPGEVLSPRARPIGAGGRARLGNRPLTLPRRPACSPTGRAPPRTSP